MTAIIRDPDRLYNLLPAVYRERDEAVGYPLRDLLRIIGRQSDIVKNDIQLLWDNFFIETSESWAIPYIGELVGNNLLNVTRRAGGDAADADLILEVYGGLAGPDFNPPNAIRTRADVAKTIYYRRRKATVPMLEELARDVTGWAAHAVEFFQLLVWSQHLNHVRLESAGCSDLRDPEVADRLNGAFDTMSHTVDVRYPAQFEGWHNIRNIGFFLWRLRSYPMENVRAREGGAPWQYSFSPLGNASPLFSRLLREGDEAGLATELHVPGPIRPAAFYKDTAPLETMIPPLPDSTQFYGLFSDFPGSTMAPNPQASLVIIRDGVPVPPNQVRCRNLDPWVQPAGNVVGVDVRRGRMALGAAFGPATSVDVFYHYGFSADMGGGPYDRSRWLVNTNLDVLRLQVREGGVAPIFPDIDQAINDWVARGRPNAVISIADNRTYTIASPLELATGRSLAIEAADGVRPHIMPDGGELRIEGDHPDAELTLSGLLFEGGVHVKGDMRRLRLVHSTLVPGRGLDPTGLPATNSPSVVVEETGAAGTLINTAFRLHATFSITGPLRLPRESDALVLLDSIVDGLDGAAIAATNTDDQPGPPGTLLRVTVFGTSFFRRLPLASEVIFTGIVQVTRLQDGCVRFSFVKDGSVTPRRYRCQPEFAIQSAVERAEEDGTPLPPAQKAALAAQIRQHLVPTFTDFHYGLPGYAQLKLGSPGEIRTGAEDGSEMGAFCHLKQPQRETNLRIRLEEYLPFGLDPGIIYVT